MNQGKVRLKYFRLSNPIPILAYKMFDGSLYNLALKSFNYRSLSRPISAEGLHRYTNWLVDDQNP